MDHLKDRLSVRLSNLGIMKKTHSAPPALPELPFVTHVRLAFMIAAINYASVEILAAHGCPL